MISTILYIFVGVILGTISGIIPGIHVNTLIVLLLSFSSITQLSATQIAIVIMSAAITHSILDFIPAILLGAPSEDSVAVMLPGHRMLLRGKGIEAIEYTILGGLLATVFIWPILLYVYHIVEVYKKTFYNGALVALLSISAWCIVQEKTTKQKVIATAVAVLAGVLGILAQNKISGNCLFPILTGLFAIPTLLESIPRKGKIPVQYAAHFEIPRIRSLSAGILGALAGTFVGILPGIGPAQAAIITNHNAKTEEYLLTVGGINTASAITGIYALYHLNVARSGAVLAIQQILPNITMSTLILLCGTVLTSAGLAAIGGILISKQLCTSINKIEYTHISKVILCSIFMLVYLLSGTKGIILLITSAAIGIIPVKTKVRRVHLMNVLILPLLWQQALI